MFKNTAKKLFSKKIRSEISVSNDEDDGDVEHVTKKRWKPLPIEDAYEEFHPCQHRWLHGHPRSSSPTHKRYIVRPLPKNIEMLSKPLCRRMLNVWTCYSDFLPADLRAQLSSRLLDCGYTEDQLEQFLEDEKRRKEIEKKFAERGPFDILDEYGNAIKQNSEIKKAMRKKKNKSQTDKKKALEKAEKERETAEVKKKKRKPKKKEQGSGKSLKKPHKGKLESAKNQKKAKKKGKDGSKKKKEPKRIEEPEYKKGKPGQLKTGWPHKTGVQMMLNVWALADSLPNEAYISSASSYFDVQAFALFNAISKALGIAATGESNLTPFMTRIKLGCLNFSVWLGQNVTGPATEISDEEIPRLLAKRGDPVSTGGKAEISEDKEEHLSQQRIWEQRQFSFSAPAYNVENQTEPVLEEDGFDNDDFLEKAKHYDPECPEFMYGGARTSPRHIVFNEDISSWKIENVEMAWQLSSPSKVPSYFSQLRPFLRSEDVWYLMSREDFFRGHSTSWNTPSTVEIIEMVINLIRTMVTTPNLTVPRVMELIDEVCLAITLNFQDEVVEEATQILDSKRTIIIERIFVSFFSTKFRDFDDESADRVRVLCHICAVFLRHLYEHTALELWRLQQNPYMEEEENLEESVPETDDGQEAMEKTESEEVGDDSKDQKWSEWIDFIKGTIQTGGSWVDWLRESVDHLEGLSEPRDELMQTALRWLEIGADIERKAEVFANF